MKAVHYGWLDRYCGGLLPDLNFQLSQLNQKESSLSKQITDEEGPVSSTMNRIDRYNMSGLSRYRQLIIVLFLKGLV